MEIVAGIILLALLVTAIVALATYTATRARIQVSFSSSPQVVCRSGSCVLEAVWEVTSNRDELQVSLVLIRPDQQRIVLSANTSGSLHLASDDESMFGLTGNYVLRLHATADDVDRTEERTIAYFHEPEFTLDDPWNTGFTGGALAQDETSATHSLVLSQEPFIGAIVEIDSKQPSTLTVCAKSTQLRSLTYRSGTIRADGTGVRKLELTLRRPATDAILTQTLELGEVITLDPPQSIDDGLEILSTMRSEADPPRSISSSSWTVQLGLSCLP